MVEELMERFSARLHAAGVEGDEVEIRFMVPRQCVRLGDVWHGVRADVAGESLGIAEWQPIETAPKDGTEILLVWHWKTDLPGHEGWTVVTARWMCAQHCHLSTFKNCPNEPDCDMRWDHYAGEMLYWMPKPKMPPEIEALKARKIEERRAVREGGEL